MKYFKNFDILMINRVASSQLPFLPQIDIRIKRNSTISTPTLKFIVKS